MADKRSENEAGSVNRRTLLKTAGVAACGVAFARALSPLTAFSSTLDRESLLQQHYKELSDEDKQRVFRRLEQRTEREYGARVSISDAQPEAGVEMAYALNLTNCLGCRQCADACHHENNHDRRSRNSYIRVFEMEQGSLDLGGGTTRYDHPVPREGKFYMPVQCHQCARPACVNVCPVKATWKEKDGPVVVDHNWCIGCRYCEAACPYHARRFNWHKPEIPANQVNPDQGYLSNRIRPQSVMEKCTFCLHRTREGKLPACLEACPAGARVFGNLRDPHSPVRQVLAEKRVFILKEEQGTVPRFFYFFAE